MATKAYQRRDLPDGFSDRVAECVNELRDGADDLRAGSLSRDEADHHHARIDAERLMRRTADRLEKLR